MKKLLLFLFCIPFLGTAQNSHTINTVGSTFSPSSLTINVGDTVNWNNTGGFHNVNATQVTFPNNPEGFGNTVAGAGWSFQWIFTIAGTYDYQCDPHAPGMSGVIIANVIPIPGCTDSLACNYDPTATIDDGSCLTAYGCMDSTAINYDPLATCDDGSCMPPAQNLFFSEYGEGSSNNKYFEIYNPTADTVDLTNYAFARVSNNPGNGAGVYEFWVDFDSAAIILPNDVYVVVHPSADSLILIESDMEYGSLSNGDDGFALVYGNNPGTPMSPSAGGYQILDWIGDWNGDPGSGWDVAGENNATANHTLIRKCDVIQGDTSWINAAGTDPVNSQWIVLANDDWSDIGQHIILPCNLIYGCMDSLACNYDPNAILDDGSCIYPGQTYQYNISICNGDSALIGGMYYSQAGLFIDSLINTIGCDSIVHTNLTIYSQFNSIYGGIPNNTLGGGGFYSGQQNLELSCYMPSELVSAVIYSQDTTLTTFEIRDDNGNVLDSVIANIIPGGHRIYFNYNMSAGSDYELGINGASNNLFRNNSGVNYPYNFGSLASVTSSSAGGNYYYFFYDIEVKQSSQPTNYSICDGESITVGGSVYNTTGLYTDSLTSSIGCDSLVFTNLIVNPNIVFTNNQTICIGETYTINGNIYDTTGTYIDSLQTISGCDSIVTTNLTILSISSGSSINNQMICIGDSIMIGTSTYFMNGTYFDTLISSNSCDSIVTTNLMVQTANYTSINGGILDTVNGPGDFSNYNGSLLLNASVATLIKSANIYALDTNIVTFELRDSSGLVLESVTHTVYPGIQNLNFNFTLPIGTNYQLGINGGNPGLYRGNADTTIFAYPFISGPVSITSSVAGNQYYYFYYDIEFMPFSSYNEVNLCPGDSLTVGSNVYSIAGQYTDVLIANNSCDSIVVTVLEFYQSPQLNITSSPSPAEICLGETILLEGSAGFSYYWWDNGSTGSILTDVPTENTWYLLSAKDSNDCVVKKDIWVFVDSCITGFDNLGFEEGELQIYPNPASDKLTIDFTGSATIIKVYNMVGELVIEKYITKGQNSVQLFVKEWKGAMYSLQLHRENGIISHEVFTVVR
jgi:plastocyanin